MKLDESAEYIPNHNRAITSIYPHLEPTIDTLGITKVSKSSLNRLGIYLPQ